MGKMHTDDSFMYEGLPIGDAMQKAWENQMLDDYETPADMSSVETDPLVNRITYQRGPKAPSTESQEKALEELVRNAEELDLYDDEIVHDLTKPLSQQIGGEHYSRQKIQPVEFIHANDLGFCEGNCIKYVCRWKYKGGIQDLEKAKHYIEMLIDMERSKNDE